MFPRVLRALSARIVTFGEYSVSFEEVDDEQICVVRTWEKHTLLEVCVHAEPAGQRVPTVELAALSRLVSVIPGSRLPLSIRGGSPTLLRVLSDNRDDGRQFAFCREFSCIFAMFSSKSSGSVQRL